MPAAPRMKALVDLPSWLMERVPRDHRETEAELARRRWVVAGVSVVGTSLLGLSLSTRPGSPEFYVATLSVAGVWAAGGLAAGRLHLGWMEDPDQTLRRPVIAPILTGVYSFGLCYGAALLARRIPVLNEALCDVLRFAAEGSGTLVLLTALANGAAEEVFFRGALYAAVGDRHPVVLSTAAYSLATAVTRNPALVLAAGAMGSVFALQRRASGGIQAPVLTHLTWAALMLRFVTPLFRRMQT
ncbi:MAG: CPBP family intramembrane metalloprotease [Actinomycetota bacterium]|nr:CPBP family intramembrane metalloprotease [Actinomycetota bacterium]